MPVDRSRKANDCKGILVIGTFRKTPLEARDPQQDFPEPVLRLIEREEICALTGLQLLGMVLECRSDPSQKGAVRNEILSTCGVLTRGRDWKTFLSLDPED
jgi:hypothetical protein